MKPDPIPTRDAANALQPTYASRAEVDDALSALTRDDHLKLLMIARAFCKWRKLAPTIIEPEDLLSQAILATCRMRKKWNKEISMVRHLDRAMENISGHLVKKAATDPVVIPFPEHSIPERGLADSDKRQASPESLIIEREECAALLRAVFGDDDEAVEVFLLRVDKVAIPQILSTLKISMTRYEAISKRIRRKIAIHLR